MEKKEGRLKEFQFTWRNRPVWVDVYKDYYRVSLPDGQECRLTKGKEGWQGWPALNIVEELGQLIDLHEQP